MNFAFLSRFTLLLFASLFLQCTLFAQVAVTTAKTRVYATLQNNGTSGIVIGNVTNASRAIDANPSTFSSLNMPIAVLGGTVYQNLVFPGDVPAGTKVTVKVGIPNGVLAVLPSLSIQAHQGNGGGAAVGPIVSVGNILGALSVGTASQFELTLTAAGNWKAIRASLVGIVSAGINAPVYEAYYETDNLQPGCEQMKAYDVISGVTFAAGLITDKILNVTGSVVNPLNEIDGNPATYLEFNTNIANVLGSYYSTAVFRSNYTAGDKINLLIGTDNNLLDATVLSAITLTTYLDDVAQESFPLNSALVDLELLSGGTKASLTISPTMAFNRAKVTLNSAVSVGLFASLRLYEISKVYSPVLGVGSDNKTIYSGHTATLAATPSGVGDVLTWYDHNTTTPVLTTGNNFVTPVLTLTTKYDVYASGRYNCPDLSGKSVSTVTVLNVNFPSPVNGIINVPYSSNIQVTGPDAAGRTYNYTLSAGSGPLPPGLTLNLDGTITGTPTTLGFYPFTVDIVDVTNPTFVLPVTENHPYSIAIRKVQVLPVTLEYFNAQPKANSSLLTWATSGGQNNKGFGIERSADANIWNSLGTVESKSAGGNSNSVYSFTDVHVNNGVNYYRLKMIDINGDFSYSKVVKVEFVNGRMKVSIYPNPTSSSFYIDGIEDGSQLRIFDGVGKLILSKEAINNHHMVNLEGLANGSYFMIIKDKENQTSKHTIIKK